MFRFEERKPLVVPHLCSLFTFSLGSRVGRNAEGGEEVIALVTKRKHGPKRKTKFISTKQSFCSNLFFFLFFFKFSDGRMKVLLGIYALALTA